MTTSIPRPRESADDLRPLVLVVIGTDVHPFDRLMRWLENWYDKRADKPRLVVQHGHTAAPALPGAVAFLGHEELQQAMASASVIISHGGPGTITEARRNGTLPICVPRDPTLGEHIDNHQQLFSRRLGADSLVRLCEDETGLLAELDAGVADPAYFALDAQGDQSARIHAVAKVGQIIEGLIVTRMRGNR